MIFKIVLTIILFNVTLVKCDNKRKHCSYSKYMWNYFKLNEHYLLQMYKNIEIYTEEDLKKYGRAIQTHGDVVLLMIQDLLKIDSDHFPYDLMSVNLYLNNNSGSINVMYRYETSNNIGYNKVFLGIQGLRLQNYSMMVQLERYIDSYCSIEQIAEFVEYPKNNISNELNIDKINIFTNDLREKMIKEINPEKVDIYKMTLYHPLNVLFYNIMLNESDIYAVKGTESRQHQEFDVDGNPKNILDLLRFAPLDIQCTDDTNLTVHDIFRFMKYQYLCIDMRAFQVLLLGASFYPVGILIANYVHLVSEIIQNDINIQNYEEEDFISIQCLGEKVKFTLQSFIKLEIFIDPAKNFFVSLLKHLYVIVYWCRGTRTLDKLLPSTILKKLKDFMYNIMLKFNVKLETITEENLIDIHKTILKDNALVDLYLQELSYYRNSFYLIYVIQPVGRINIKDFKFLLTPNLIDVLCADNPIDYCNSKNDKSDTSDNSNEINVYDLGNNDGLDEFKTENIEHFKEVAFKRKQNKSLNLSIDMKDFPKHMVDYFLCSE
ncbi:uncharacterized protein LOC126900498 isoform X3 [Daktulosphaira vitifoliae]|uniref:uncharacterized protein LOC126900498 isoform X3 n=1 Tax=Daktulosphaira vitifoliae TaxID=58002 RepID=UPI0021AADE8F|nr:uncharacterized protein LOC126900498 isoform X3 [Daktulosphaira vitifoliae]